ncbi:hypothetical protein Vse01_21900 [Micromonospora sediminimaris]|uniref:Uncharacterized protein n=1 Tax=Micromonospora sediminimaris TaxID=547162 RepID=A0A9W5UPZ2_9ACTN|nr:hypothetical protein Vse01_21900 [Micromonospora sediminimaris]
MALAAAVIVCRRVSFGKRRLRFSVIMTNLSGGGAQAPAVTDGGHDKPRRAPGRGAGGGPRRAAAGIDRYVRRRAKVRR